MRERILVLEDDAGLRSALCEVLEDEGFEVVAAERAQEAVTRAEHEGFDLIVADIRMPGMDGLEAVEAVRQTQPAIRTVVMTGYSSEADSVRALKLGIHDYLRKPFEVEAFLEAVQRQIHRRREEQRLQARERSARRVVLWALEGHLLNSDPSAPGLCRLAHSVCLHYGLAEEEAEEVRILALAELLSRRGMAADVSTLREALTTEFRSWIGQLGDSPEELPLGARVAMEAVRRSLGQGPADPEVAAAFDSAAHADSSGQSTRLAASAARRRKGLVALAQALEESDAEEAGRLYEELARDKSPNAETVAACMGLVRLRPRAQLPNLAALALSLARQVGPTSYAQTALTLGLLQGGGDGLQLVGQARQIFAQLPGSTALAAQAQLAQWALDDRPVDDGLRQLLAGLSQDPSHSAWHSSASWLTPYLLRWQSRQATAEVGAALLRLVRTSPALGASLLTASGREEQLALLQVLRGQRLQSLEGAVRHLEGQAADSAVREAARSLLQSGSDAPVSSMLRLYSLGQLEVVVGDEPVPASSWTNRKQVILLAYLASHPGPQPEDVIIDHLWPSKDASKGRNNINTALSNLRRVLKNMGNEQDYFKRDKRGVYLDVELPFWHDLSEFGRSLTLAGERGAAPERVQELLRRACSLYRGPFLEGTYYEWADPIRQREETRMTEALLGLGSLCLDREQHLEAVEHSQRVLELDPCCQEACTLVMRGYLGLRRAEEAVRTFERCRKALRNDLGMEPAISLLELHQRALLSQSQPA